jgi:hypothetical protein
VEAAIATRKATTNATAKSFVCQECEALDPELLWLFSFVFIAFSLQNALVFWSDKRFCKGFWTKEEKLSLFFYTNLIFPFRDDF